MTAVLYLFKSKKNKMARKRKRSTSHRRRRRIGAMSMTASNPIVQIGSIAAGFFLIGQPLNNMLDQVTAGKIDGKLIGGAEAGIGALLLLKKGRKDMLTTVAGGVLIGAGAKRLLKELGVIAGFQSVPVLGGYKSVPVLGGYTPSGAGINGYTAPKPMHTKVMGAVDRSTGCAGSDCMP